MLRRMSPSSKIALGIFCGVILLYGAAFALLFSLAQSHGADMATFLAAEDDARGYVALARTLLETGQFNSPFNGGPEYFRTPLYPVFVGGLIEVFDSLATVALVQILLLAGSASLLFLLGERFFSRFAGIGAAILFVLDPTTLIQTLGIYTEIPFVFLLLSGIYLIIHTRSLSNHACIIAGLLFGAMMLVRPIGLYILPLVVLGMMFISKETWTKTFRSAAIVLIAALLVAGPWAARNYVVGGSFAISSIGSYNPLFYNVVLFEAYRRGVGEQEIVKEISTKLGTSLKRDWRSFAYAHKAKALTREYLSGHWFEYAWFHLVKTLPFVAGSGWEVTKRQFHNNKIFVSEKKVIDTNVTGMILAGKWSDAWNALRADTSVFIERLVWVFLFTFAGAFSLLSLVRQTPTWRVALLLCVLIAAFALITGPLFAPRFRTPAEPFVFILALEGVRLFYMWLKRRLRVFPQIH